VVVRGQNKRKRGRACRSLSCAGQLADGAPRALSLSLSLAAGIKGSTRRCDKHTHTHSALLRDHHRHPRIGCSNAYDNGDADELNVLFTLPAPKKLSRQTPNSIPGDD